MRKILEISNLDTRDDIEHGIIEICKAINDALSNAESCETLDDLIDNLEEARAASSELIHLWRAATNLRRAALTSEEG